MDTFLTSNSRYNSSSYGSYSGNVTIPETFLGPKNFEYTVTAIGDNAFRNCYNLTAVSIPNTVETIGSYAFYGCSSLTELVLPSLVDDIGAYAFYNCSSLTAMALPSFVTAIRAYTFYGCSKLTSVTIPSNLTTLESDAFRGCSKLPRVTLPQTLTSIGQQAFYGCTSLATVSMSNALTSIGSEAFRGCTSLTAITLPDVLTTVGSGAFYGTTSLSSVTIPASLTSLGTDAFSGSGLQTLTYASGCTTALRTWATNLTSVTMASTITSIPDYAFYNCSLLSTVNVPSKVKTIGESAFQYCSSLTSVSLPSVLTTVGSKAFYGTTSLRSVTIPASLTSLGTDAFSGSGLQTLTYANGCTTALRTYATGLVKVTMASTITSIPDKAFYNCSLLSTAAIPSNVTVIGSEAFRGCSSLTSVTLPDVLTTVGSSAFYGTTSLQSVNIPASLTSLGSDAFNGSGLQTLTYADGCTTALRTYATGLVSVTMASTITDIPDYAFYNCSQLSTTSIPSKVKTIGVRAFYGCSSLTKISIPAATTSIGENAFASSGLSTLTYAKNTKTALRTYATQLTKVTLPSTLKTISDNCFYGCTKLAGITLPAALETIGNSAFYNCSSLTTLTVPASLTAIGSNAFYGTNIQTLMYAQGCTTALRTYATTVASVYLPNTLAHFAPDVFQGCNSLENIHVADLEMWNYIFSQETSNPLPIAHRIYLNGNLLTALNADFGCEVSPYAFAQCMGLKQVNVTNSITAIEDYAFMQCPDLEAVAMGHGTECIGTNAFQGCTSLSAVRLGNGLKVIGKNAFNGCSELNSLLMGDNVQRIEEGAFRGCYKLVKAQLPATLTTLGASAFRDCYELQEVIIPAGVTTIPDYAFYDCRKMETLEIGEAVTDIGSYAFYGCKSLRLLNVPDATKTIGSYSFNNCETIRYIYLGTGVTSIGSYAFANNPTNMAGFYCRAVSVPSCGSNTFSGSDPQFSELYVPDESLTAYSNQSPWSSFGTKKGLSSAPIFVSSITLSAPVLVMEEGDIDNISATVAPQDATNPRVNWSSSNTDVVYVSKSGGVMANEEGVATITCKAADDNGARANSLVIVSNNFRQTTEITLSNTSLSLPEGKEAHLTASTSPSNATYSAVTWTSSNPLVAQVSDVGYVTALSVGTATITCAAADGKGAEATCTVKVTEPVDPTIGDANEDGNVSVGDLTYVVSIIMDRIEQGEDISLYDVDGDGIITIDDVVSIADIILGYNVEPAVRLLELSATELTIGIDETTRLNHKVIPYKMDSNLTWSSSNENVVTVTGDGILTAVNAGTAVVTVADVGGLSAECVVTVDGSYGITNGHAWVDLGLPSGTRWATVNLGAGSPQEYGNYYAWGETQPKDTYTWNTYQHCNGSATTLTKYCTSPNKGTRDDKTILESIDDAATAAWGENWCMPSEDQFAELFNTAYTNSVWTERNGLYGRLVTSRVNGNSVFLPAAGYMNGSSLSSGGSGGYYATVNLSSNCDYNRSLNLGSSNATLTDTYRCYGQSIRPVFSMSVVVTPSTAWLDVGETITLQAVIRTNTGTSTGTVTWSSSDKTVATVNSKGKVTAKALGKAIIYATNESGLCGTSTITVGHAESQYLTFEALEDGTFSFSQNPIQYSIDNGTTWNTLAVGSSTPTITTGNKIMWKASGLTPSSTNGIGRFSSTGRYNVYGNIMSLVAGDNFANTTTIIDNQFRRLFYNRSELISAENLILPSTTLADNCYYWMFRACSNLTTPPQLPATTLSESCYNNMFGNCTSLTTAPTLPATTLTDYCYSNMFTGCTLLTTAPSLPATTLASHCYADMFSGCTSLTTAPSLPATTLAEGCYSNMFTNCTSLTAAPTLTATTLAKGCYSYMFEDCTSLTAAPTLPATTLTEGCYCGMFLRCGNLTSAPTLPVTTLARNCYAHMFSGCTSLTTAPSLPATTLASWCYEDMFNNCTSLTTAPELPATTLAEGCYGHMFHNCTSLNYIKAMFTTTPSIRYTESWVSGVAASGTFVKNANATWNVTGTSGVPSGWTVQRESQSLQNDVNVVTVNGVSFKMVHVAGGTFPMGATSEQGSYAYDSEKPVHSVTLSDYYIGETEVTQALWYAVMGYKPTSGGSQWTSSYGIGDDFPAYYVSWNDCQEFITKLNQLTGMSFRLPTEAEWEFAARGGNNSQGYKYAGSNTVDDVAWYLSNSSSKTHPVGTKSPNELGLYDMSGNVWEWCQDWYGSYGSTAQTDPTGPSSGSYRVRRGGWNSDAGFCRVSIRYGNTPSSRYLNSGLRLAL